MEMLATMLKKFECKREEEIPAVASELLDLIGPIRIIAFNGELGSGKTTLIKAMCRKLGIKDDAASPTFAIMYEYSLPNDLPVYHFDFYRINSETEVFDIGYENFFYSNAYCFIEWAERVKNLLPPGSAHININVEKHARIITLSI